MKIYIDEDSGSVYGLVNMGDYGVALFQYPINSNGTCEITDEGTEVDFESISENERVNCLSIKRILENN